MQETQETTKTTIEIIVLCKVEYQVDSIDKAGLDRLKETMLDEPIGQHIYGSVDVRIKG